MTDRITYLKNADWIAQTGIDDALGEFHADYDVDALKKRYREIYEAELDRHGLEIAFDGTITGPELAGQTEQDRQDAVDAVTEAADKEFWRVAPEFDRSQKS